MVDKFWLRYKVNTMLPEPILMIVRLLRNAVRRPSRRNEIPLLEDFPYLSLNIWQRITDFYLELSSPIVFEWGTGASSLHHIKTLLNHRMGTYIGVEHNQEWYVKVISALTEFCIQSGYSLESSVTYQSAFSGGYTATFRIKKPNGSNCLVLLKLRPPLHPFSGDGSFEEFRGYVEALDDECDVVIVDGRARNACISRALDTPYLRTGGMLSLLDAGRGLEGWLGYPTQTGTSNYQSSVQRMLGLGGGLVDGCGLDIWPGLKKRRTSHPKSYRFPAEACILVKP